MLAIQVQGHPARLIVDTGFQGLLLYQERLLNRVSMLRGSGSLIVVSIGGRLQAKQVVNRRLSSERRTEKHPRSS